jgi:hypothetical protein
MADGFPVLGRGVRIACGAKHDGSEKKQDNQHREQENHDGKDQQLFVLGHDGERTFEQQPASLELAHNISLVGMMIIGSRLVYSERPAPRFTTSHALSATISADKGMTCWTKITAVRI